MAPSESSGPRSPVSDRPVVEISELTRRFGHRTALDAVSLSVERGFVHGLVGANGAGKTTLIRHMLGLYRAQSGSVRVFGVDPVSDPVAVLRRVGYLSEDHDLPGWMRVGELLRYTRAFYDQWDDGYAAELRTAFGLDPSARIGKLSRGQKARSGLLQALAHRPALLVLDEPSSGLDPVVRRDILGAILRTIADEGRTMLFSSHLLDEVERVADHVTMIDRGRVVHSGPLEDLMRRHHCLDVRFDPPRAEPPVADDVLSWDGGGREWTAIVQRNERSPEARAEAWGGRLVAERAASFDEIFIAHVGRSPSAEGS